MEMVRCQQSKEQKENDYGEVIDEDYNYDRTTVSHSYVWVEIQSNFWVQQLKILVFSVKIKTIYILTSLELNKIRII